MRRVEARRPLSFRPSAIFRPDVAPQAAHRGSFAAVPASAYGERFTRLVRPRWPSSPELRLACLRPKRHEVRLSPTRRRRAGGPGGAAVAFALTPAGIARGFLAPNYQPFKRATLHAFKTCGNPPKTGGNRAQTGAKNAENSRLVGNLRINQPITASACLRWEGSWDRISNFADARARPARGPAPPRSRDFEPLL